MDVDSKSDLAMLGTETYRSSGGYHLLISFSGHSQQLGSNCIITNSIDFYFLHKMFLQDKCGSFRGQKM